MGENDLKRIRNSFDLTHQEQEVVQKEVDVANANIIRILLGDVFQEVTPKEQEALILILENSYPLSQTEADNKPTVEDRMYRLLNISDKLDPKETSDTNIEGKDNPI